jgi:TolB-like protein/Flp pilus assembly protein TadD
MLSWEEGRLENIKIIDLGLAKGATEDTLSMAGSFIGTPTYASPEQFAGLGTDIRSDLYSLGVTLWEMLSGNPPFQGSAAELMDQHQRAAPPLVKLRNIPEPIITLLQVLLEKDPGQRFLNPAQLQNALTKIKGAVGSGLRLTADELLSVSAQVTPKASKRKPRKPTVRWVLGVGLCLAGGLIAWFSFFGHAGFLSNQRITEAAPTEKSVAVLPFESLSESKSDAYFADGVQDEILNNLAKVGQLKVICRTSVMQYRGDTKRDLRQIATLLGVATVLEGTVRRDGNHVRVSTELVDARSDNTIWADSYDRDLTDIFAIQSEIAQRVASSLSAQLSPKERKEIEERPTNDLEAYDLYLQAKQLISSVGLVSSEKQMYSKAISLLEEATQRDPKFALGYCLLAKAHDYLCILDQKPYGPAGLLRIAERCTAGDAAVNEAFRLRPDLSEVHLAMAQHLFAYNDSVRARIQIDIASKTMSNDPELLQLSAVIDQEQGRWEKSIAGLEKAATLDPRNPDLLDTLEYTYFCLRQYRNHERILERLIELEPDQPSFRLKKADSLFAERADLKGVRAVYETLPPSVKDDPEVTAHRVYYAICARDFTAAEEIVSKARNQEIAFAGTFPTRSPMTPGNVPPRVITLWLEFLKGNHPTVEEFGAAREELYPKLQVRQGDPFLYLALAFTNIALGRNEQGVEEARHAMAIRGLWGAFLFGPLVAANAASVYGWANQPDSAFEELNILVKMPSLFLNYGDLKTNPTWDPLRKDPRFDKLLAELAPRD